MKTVRVEVKPWWVGFGKDIPLMEMDIPQSVYTNGHNAIKDEVEAKFTAWCHDEQYCRGDLHYRILTVNGNDWSPHA